MIFIDGKIIREQEAFCPILYRSFLFGDGLYTTILIEDKKIFLLKEHVDSLIQEVNLLYLSPLSLCVEDVYRFLDHCNTEGRWSFKIIYAAKYGSERRLIKDREAALVMIIEKIGPRPENPLKVGIYPEIVQHPVSRLKSLAHLPRYFIMEYAQSHNLDDALTTDAKGSALECAFANIFWIEKDCFYTPCPSLPLFFGVTITKCIEMAQKANLKIIYEKKPPSAINSSVFLFRCNTLNRVCAIETLGQRKFLVDQGWVDYFNSALEVGEPLR